MKEFILPSKLEGIHIHFVGIKGTGMAALTEILVNRGAVITGSDVADVFYTDEVLKRCGIESKLFSKDNITKDLCCVIYSSAYNSKTNCELARAEELNIPCVLYSEALGQISSHAFSCGIAGVHGKTTTTGITGTLLKAVDLPVQVLAGSVISSFGNENGSCTLLNGKKYFVAETCEYQRHFMSFHPKKIILTSIESDHQDFYPTYNDILQAFIDYCCKLPENGELIFCADDAGAVEAANIVKSKRPDILLTPYGLNATGQFQLSLCEIENGKQYFNIAGFNNYKFALKISGVHLVRNATAAIALTVSLLKEELNLSVNEIFENTELLSKMASGLLDFKGGKRRSEIIGQINNITFIDDYGHHPTAIKTTLEGYKKFYPNCKIIVDFMAHTYTRTAALLDEFASSFESAHEVILHKIYGSARENASETGVTGELLYKRTCEKHSNVRYYNEVMDAYDELLTELSKKDSSFPEGIVFVTMGAGDNWKLGKELFNSLKQRSM